MLLYGLPNHGSFEPSFHLERVLFLSSFAERREMKESEFKLLAFSFAPFTILSIASFGMCIHFLIHGVIHYGEKINEISFWMAGAALVISIVTMTISFFKGPERAAFENKT